MTAGLGQRGSHRNGPGGHTYTTEGRTSLHGLLDHLGGRHSRHRHGSVVLLFLRHGGSSPCHTMAGATMRNRVRSIPSCIRIRHGRRRIGLRLAMDRHHLARHGRGHQLAIAHRRTTRSGGQPGNRALAVPSQDYHRRFTIRPPIACRLQCLGIASCPGPHRRETQGCLLPGRLPHMARCLVAWSPSAWQVVHRRFGSRRMEVGLRALASALP